MQKVDHDYKFGKKVMLNHNYDIKYETPYKGPFEVSHRWTNGTVISQCGVRKLRYNIHRIKAYKSGTNDEYIIAKTDATLSNSDITVIYFCLYVT